MRSGTRLRAAHWLTVGVTALLPTVMVMPGSAAVEGAAPATVPLVGEPSADLASFYLQQPQWSPCDGGFECTKVTVPLDYADPTGTTIQIAVTRLKAVAPQGSLVINPGGPGGSGIAYARVADEAFSSQLLAAYDIVGFDPRGVGAPNAVQCLTDKQLDRFLSADWTPDTLKERARLVALSRQFGEACARKSPMIATHMSTLETAKDMDIIRAALGEQKLNFLGKSYGTLLGARYADLFPANVGRFVLDGVMPSSVSLDEGFAEQARSDDAGLRRFVVACHDYSDCPLSGSVKHGIAQIQAFLARLDRKPIRGWAGRSLNESLATAALADSLYGPLSWDRLRGALIAGFAGNGEPLLSIQDQYAGRSPIDGSYEDNSFEAFYATICLDAPALGGIEGAQALAVQNASTAPVFGASIAWQMLPCWQWPSGPPVSLPPASLAPIHATGSGPILVVSTVHDPGTPYSWGVKVAGELDNATLLTFDGDTHTAYWNGSSCIDDAVDAYLIHGVVPADGVVCKPDA
jgi:pimeloyl-ACP methyl ester carboxylesterase